MSYLRNAFFAIRTTESISSQYHTFDDKIIKFRSSKNNNYYIIYRLCEHRWAFLRPKCEHQALLLDFFSQSHWNRNKNNNEVVQHTTTIVREWIDLEWTVAHQRHCAWYTLQYIDILNRKTIFRNKNKNKNEIEWYMFGSDQWATCTCPSNTNKYQYTWEFKSNISINIDQFLPSSSTTRFWRDFIYFIRNIKHKQTIQNNNICFFFTKWISCDWRSWLLNDNRSEISLCLKHQNEMSNFVVLFRSVVLLVCRKSRRRRLSHRQTMNRT